MKNNRRLKCGISLVLAVLLCVMGINVGSDSKS